MNTNDINRRQFLKLSGVTAFSVLTSQVFLSCSKRSGRPNIIWITSEDNGPFLGCYGDDFATTPNLDRLASEGILYENAFANAAVCAPARSTIISGMYNSSMGTHHMRSQNAIPEFIRFLPEYLMEAGYYCSNNRKEDYNMPKPDKAWHESSGKAHYENRQPGQPFFSIFNITVSHESSIHTWSDDLKHDPARVILPPYHPDTPEMRHDWAQYYDKVQDMDERIGTLLKELDASGLAEDTIVFYYSDHGGVVARSKRFLYDSGTHVPMIIRFPAKYRHLAPAKPGSGLDRLVSFVDLAPTILSLVGIQIPDYMQGEAFLGNQKKKSRKYIYFSRDRMDERYDMMRSVRDGRFRYIRNYMPHRIYGQYLEYLWKAPSMRSWEKAFHDGKCNETQRIFWGVKPVEELYDIQSDPHEVRNLAGDPDYKEVLQRMRKANKKWIRDIRDTGFIPEGEMLERIRQHTAYELVQDDQFSIERIIETAELAGEGNPENLPVLLERLKDEEAAVRYWAATGCTILGESAQSVTDSLLDCLGDPSADVRIAVAEALCSIGEMDQGLPVIIQETKNSNSKVALHALNVLDAQGEGARSALTKLELLIRESRDNYIIRASRHIFHMLGNG